MAQGAELLEAVDDRVRSDVRPPGWSGKVGIGVWDGGSPLWWQATFAQGAETRIARHLDADVGAAILLPAGGERPLLYGDRGLLRDLVVRYLARLSPISIRFPAKKGAKR